MCQTENLVFIGVYFESDSGPFSKSRVFDQGPWFGMILSRCLERSVDNRHDNMKNATCNENKRYRWRSNSYEPRFGLQVHLKCLSFVHDVAFCTSYAALIIAISYSRIPHQRRAFQINSLFAMSYFLSKWMKRRWNGSLNFAHCSTMIQRAFMRSIQKKHRSERFWFLSKCPLIHARIILINIFATARQAQKLLQFLHSRRSFFHSSPAALLRLS